MKKKEILLAISNFLYHEAMINTAPGYTGSDDVRFSQPS